MGENMAELTGHRGGARRRVPVRTLAEALKNNIVLLVALLAAAVTCFLFRRTKHILHISICERCPVCSVRSRW